MKIKNIIGFALASTALLFSGLTVTAFNHVQEKVEETQAWSSDVKPDLPDKYYSACEGKSGSALKSALAGFNKPKTKSYDWSRYEAADEAQDDSTSILCVYTRHNIKKSSHCGNYSWDKWNREHVYTQTAFPNSDDDNHNIFACEGQINNYRGNLKFAEGGERLTVFGHVTDCYKTSSTFEPCDDAKGEIARACMYCTIYYGYNLTQIFDSVETAVKWHVQHPVSPREIYRNNVVYGLQGNRNPFVDHPSYANTIWSTSYTYTLPDPVSEGAPAPKVDVTGVSVSPTSLKIEVDQSSTLTATVTPNNATNKNINWTSADSSVATVNNGVVKGVGVGSTTIKAKTVDGGFEATCSVTVSEKTTTTYTISFNANGGTSSIADIEVESGEYELPECGFNPPAGLKFYGWKVNNTGNILSPGTKINISSDITLYAQWVDPTDIDRTLTSIEVIPPNKVEYQVGEKLDLTGFKVIAKYDDGTTEDVTDLSTISSDKMNEPGEKTINVIYKENGETATGSFTIRVIGESNESTNNGKGCHGSIIASSALISLTSLLGLSLIYFRKKRQ